MKYALPKLPFAGKQQPQLTKKQMQSAKPVRNPAIQWEEGEKDMILLVIPRRKSGSIWAWLGGFMKLPETHRVELEAVGAAVWRLCDGKNSVEGIVRELCQKYKMNRIEAEVSLQAFLQTLAQRGYIALLVNKKK